VRIGFVARRRFHCTVNSTFWDATPDRLPLNQGHLLLVGSESMRMSLPGRTSNFSSLNLAVQNRRVHSLP
jgi:hypothetical protein